MTNAQAFQVTIPKYTGPFDLLLAAIKDDKLSIFDVSLSEITGAYFEYLKKLSTIDLSDASDFLLMASYLLEMKSKKVLPQPEDVVLQQEEEEIEQDLAKHLEEYKVFKQLGQYRHIGITRGTSH